MAHLQPLDLPITTREDGNDLPKNSLDKLQPSYFLSPPCYMNEFVSDQFWEALESRQDEIIARLDELNESIESALAEFDDAPAAHSLEEAA